MHGSWKLGRDNSIKITGLYSTLTIVLPWECQGCRDSVSNLHEAADVVVMQRVAAGRALVHIAIAIERQFEKLAQRQLPSLRARLQINGAGSMTNVTLWKIMSTLKRRYSIRLNKATTLQYRNAPL